MIKNFSLAILLMVMVFSALSCRSTSSLDRTPRRKSSKVYKNSMQKKKKASKTPRDASDDPLFDAVFKRKPQKHEGFSSLSDKERSMIQDMQSGNDMPGSRSVREDMKKSSTGRKDWVFGTKNGSYF